MSENEENKNQQPNPQPAVGLQTNKPFAGFGNSNLQSSLPPFSNPVPGAPTNPSPWAQLPSTSFAPQQIGSSNLVSSAQPPSAPSGMNFGGSAAFQPQGSKPFSFTGTTVKPQDASQPANQTPPQAQTSNPFGGIQTNSFGGSLVAVNNQAPQVQSAPINLYNKQPTNSLLGNLGAPSFQGSQLPQAPVTSLNMMQPNTQPLSAPIKTPPKSIIQTQQAPQQRAFIGGQAMSQNQTQTLQYPEPILFSQESTKEIQRIKALPTDKKFDLGLAIEFSRVYLKQAQNEQYNSNDYFDTLIKLNYNHEQQELWALFNALCLSRSKSEAIAKLLNAQRAWRNENEIIDLYATADQEVIFESDYSKTICNLIGLGEFDGIDRILSKSKYTEFAVFQFYKSQDRFLSGTLDAIHDFSKHVSNLLSSNDYYEIFNKEQAVFQQTMSTSLNVITQQSGFSLQPKLHLQLQQVLRMLTADKSAVTSNVKGPFQELLLELLFNPQTPSDLTQLTQGYAAQIFIQKPQIQALLQMRPLRMIDKIQENNNQIFAFHFRELYLRHNLLTPVNLVNTDVISEETGNAAVFKHINTKSLDQYVQYLMANKVSTSVIAPYLFATLNQTEFQFAVKNLALYNEKELGEFLQKEDSEYLVDKNRDNSLSILADKIKKENLYRLIKNEMYTEAFSELLLFEKNDVLVEMSFKYLSEFLDPKSREKVLITLGNLYVNLKPDQIEKVRNLSVNMGFLFEFIDFKEACINDQCDVVKKILSGCVRSNRLPAALLLPMIIEVQPLLEGGVVTLDQEDLTALTLVLVKEGFKLGDDQRQQCSRALMPLNILA